VLRGPEAVTRRVGGRSFNVAAAGFWQVHPAAATTLATAVLDAVRPAPGERVLELYAGAGMLSAPLADAVGRDGAVVTIESSAQAVGDAVANLTDLPQVDVRRGRVDAALVRELQAEPRAAFDVVVLDPPRAGLGQAATAALLALRPRVIAYVACDPASLARDVRVAADAGWRLSSLRAFDAFPMTAHVECLAVLVPPRPVP
jgi:tRNA/tmRNA/rRNA uracil-C5-methylase (TrmA/RlmC/RlmD family)